MSQAVDKAFLLLVVVANHYYLKLLSYYPGGAAARLPPGRLIVASPSSLRPLFSDVGIPLFINRTIPVFR